MDADEYEYAVKRIGIRLPEQTYILGDYWGDKDERQDALSHLMKVPPEGHTYKLIRRRKAGPEEEMEIN